MAFAINVTSLTLVSFCPLVCLATLYLALLPRGHITLVNLPPVVQYPAEHIIEFLPLTPKYLFQPFIQIEIQSRMHAVYQLLSA